MVVNVNIHKLPECFAAAKRQQQSDALRDAYDAACRACKVRPLSPAGRKLLRAFGEAAAAGRAQSG